MVNYDGTLIVKATFYNHTFSNGRGETRYQSQITCLNRG